MINYYTRFHHEGRKLIVVVPAKDTQHALAKLKAWYPSEITQYYIEDMGEEIYETYNEPIDPDMGQE